MNPLQTSIFLDSDKTLKVLLDRGADPNALNPKGDAPIFMVLKDSKFEMAKLLLAKGADPNATWMGNTPLMIALHTNNMKIAGLLLDHGADINQKNQKGFTLLHWFSTQNKFHIVKFLVEKGALIDQPDDLGNTPLLSAIEANKLLAVKTLVEKGASLSFKNKKGLDALQLAKSKKNQEIVEYLLSVSP
jgi:ankyrin repeat protein